MDTKEKKIAFRIQFEAIYNIIYGLEFGVILISIMDFPKAVFSEIWSQDMYSTCFPPKTKLLIGRLASSTNHRPGFLAETGLN